MLCYFILFSFYKKKTLTLFKLTLNWQYLRTKDCINIPLNYQKNCNVLFRTKNDKNILIKNLEKIQRIIIIKKNIKNIGDPQPLLWV
jgi:hypothetical protein